MAYCNAMLELLELPDIAVSYVELPSRAAFLRTLEAVGWRHPAWEESGEIPGPKSELQKGGPLRNQETRTASKSLSSQQVKASGWLGFRSFRGVFEAT